MSDFDGIALSTKSLGQLETVVAKPPAVVLLAAPDNYYLEVVATQLAAAALGFKTNKLTASPNFMALSPHPDEPYGIKTAAKQAVHFISQKSSAKSGAITKCLLINQADQLTVDAQNALLKVLEDLPAGNLVILTAPSKNSLLDTVVSRCRPISLTKPETNEVTAWLQTMFEGKDISAALRRADGWPGRARQLLSRGDAEVDDMSTAKQILGGSTFDRLVIVNQIGNDRERAIKLCETMALISEKTLAQANLDQKSARKWAKIDVAASVCQTDLIGNANTKLALTSMVLAW